MKIFAIGDTHGEHDLLEEMLEEIMKEIKPEDQIIFLGDYIDRGPKSFEVIETLVDLKMKHDNTIFLMGNHEQMLLRAIERGKFDDIMLWQANGGDITVGNYQDHGHLKGMNFHDQFPKSHLMFLKSLRMFYESAAFIFVHAGVLNNKFTPGIDQLHEMDPDIFLWVRGEFYTQENDMWGKIIIYGHSPFKTPQVRKWTIGIDTGAALEMGGTLTCIVLPEKRFIQKRKK
jgi:serine/threonine protein phosphatase 1